MDYGTSIIPHDIQRQALPAASCRLRAILPGDKVALKAKGIVMIKSSQLKCLLLLAGSLLSRTVFAQALPVLEESQVQGEQEQSALHDASLPSAPVNPASPPTLVIPAGTRVLMVLKSPLHTTSGTTGSGLYLETLYPVIQDNRVVIPAHSQIQGVVESDKRPGHLNRVAEFRFRFTTLIFPNNHVAPIEGVLQSIPGAKNIRTKDARGTVSPVDQTEKVVTPAVAGAAGGAILGANHGFGIGKFVGGGLGAAFGLGSVLLKRGDEISLARGTNVEMVLQAPLNLEADQAAWNARYVPPREAFPGMTNTPSLDHEQAPSRNPRRRNPGSFSWPGAMWLR